MKTRILLAAVALLGISANAQVVNQTVAMGAGYANQIYYKMATQTQTAYANSSWDLAFNRQSSFSMGIRTNDAKGISVFEASNDISDWASIDVSQEANWTQLYNSDTNWAVGSLDNGSATYGFGEYNFVTHHVLGSVIFVLKYADQTYKKIKIDDFFGGYSFTYSSWTDGAWTADTTATVANTANADRLFNYYNLETNSAVVAEPAANDWDFVFTKYMADLEGDGSVMYGVTGVLHHQKIKVAENNEPDGQGDTSALEFSPEINTIGYDWKTFNMESFTYEVDADKAFYVKDTVTGTVNRLVFNTFEGSSTGVVTFNFEDVTGQLSTIGSNAVTFGVFPNPSTNKKINVVYDSNSTNSDNRVSIYSLDGSKVYETRLAASGFNNTEIDLNALSSGIYLLKFDAGGATSAKKIILQ